jgi:hypothetical protein
MVKKRSSKSGSRSPGVGSEACVAQTAAPSSAAATAFPGPGRRLRFVRSMMDEVIIRAVGRQSHGLFARRHPFEPPFDVSRLPAARDAAAGKAANAQAFVTTDVGISRNAGGHEAETGMPVSSD